MNLGKKKKKTLCFIQSIQINKSKNITLLYCKQVKQVLQLNMKH